MSAVQQRDDVDGPGPRTTEDVPAEAPGALARLRHRIGGTASITLVLIAMLVWLGLLNPRFFELGPLLAFIRRAAPLMVLTAGQLFVIVSGGFDLSVGALITVTVVVAAAVSNGDPATTVPLVALLLGVGAAVGWVNGTITTRLKVPSFITTLGMLLVLRGAVFYWTSGAPRGALADNFRAFGRGGVEVGGVQVPYAVGILLVVVVVYWLLLHRSTFGQQLFAAGGGPKAATLSGVDVPRVRTLAFVLSGVAAVIAGILEAGVGGVSAQVGSGAEFQAISAVVLGGAVLGGGKGSLTAAVIGALTLQVLFTLLNILGLPAPLRDSIQGLIIIGAVLFAAYRLRRAA